VSLRPDYGLVLTVLRNIGCRKTQRRRLLAYWPPSVPTTGEHRTLLLGRAISPLISTGEMSTIFAKSSKVLAAPSYAGAFNLSSGKNASSNTTPSKAAAVYLPLFWPWA
jgi:hypothetical protein